MNASASARSRRLLRRHSVLAAITGALTALTVVAPEWIELFGLDPDHGDGSAERALLAVVASVFLGSLLLAGAAWRRCVGAAE
ncbi:MAG TPA: hypothetical protein VN088_18330 [Nocardioides sp.]|nr:hypothetical protein [Nocardioides sp.]